MKNTLRLKEDSMEKLATTAVLKNISLGEIDLDEITETLRASEMVIRSYRSELEGMKHTEENLKRDFDEEKKAVDNLSRRLVDLHEDNRLAKDLFRTEIEGKMQILGMSSTLDLEALNMAGLIKQRELVQKEISRSLGKTDVALR